MQKIFDFIDKWGVRISTILVFIVFMKTCTTNGRVESFRKQLITTNNKIDSLSTNLTKEIKIEGLKSEKRMIQSTDRNILDVNRQSEIDKELSQLEK